MKGTHLAPDDMNAHLHNQEIKVRLTETDAAMLKQLAARNGLKPAAVARMFILRALAPAMSVSHAAMAENGRA